MCAIAVADPALSLNMIIVSTSVVDPAPSFEYVADTAPSLNMCDFGCRSGARLDYDKSLDLGCRSSAKLEYVRFLLQIRSQALNMIIGSTLVAGPAPSFEYVADPAPSLNMCDSGCGPSAKL